MSGSGSGTRRGPVSVVHVHKMTGISGSENHLRQLLPALDRRRFSATLLMLTDDGPVDESFIRALEGSGVRVNALRMRGDLDPILVGTLTSWLRRERPSILHTHLIHADLHGALAARLARVPVLISTRHNDDPFRRRALPRLLDRWLVNRACRIIAISESIRRFTIDVSGVAPSRIVTVHYGYRGEAAGEKGLRSLLGIPENAPVVLSVGRLVHQKGQHDLLAAFRIVLNRVPDAHLVIIGEGPLRADLETLATSLGVAARVHLPGYLSRAAAMMGDASVYAHPSRWEGFGLVLLEAMAAGCPVVATRVSAIPEIVEDGTTGTLVPPGDPEVLAQALSALLLDPALRARYGTSGAERARSEFSVGKMAHATEQIYETCLSEADR